MIDVRLRNKASEEEVREKVGLVLTEDDYHLLVTRDATVRKPDGSVLCIYRRGIIPAELRDSTWPILSELKAVTTANRGYAGGSKRVELRSGKRSEAKRVPSAIVGAFEPQGPRRYCRLTAWTGQETAKFRILWPLLQFIGERMKIDTPDRYAAQMSEIARTHPDWVIPETPFTTVTVNNTYETGVHKDAGDLHEGISTLAVFRRGDYRGGQLVFPEYRVAVDMQDGDLLLMDAHEFHGNTFLDPRPGYTLYGHRTDKDEQGKPLYERISLVAYMRTKMVACEAAADENEKARAYGEARSAALLGE